METWVKVKDFENYEVSNLGKVRRLDSVVIQGGVKTRYKGRVLSQENVKGYKRVTLSKGKIVKRFTVHRLVLMSFTKNLYNKPCVNHINGDKLDNRLSNLEWVTYSENEIHSIKVLKKKNSNRKLSERAVIDIRENCKKATTKNSFSNVSSFMEKYNVCRHTILHVLNNKYYV